MDLPQLLLDVLFKIIIIVLIRDENMLGRVRIVPTRNPPEKKISSVTRPCIRWART